MALKHGLDISELTSSDGAVIEFDMENRESDPFQSATGGGSLQQEDDVQYDRSEVVRLEPLIGSKGESSESESDDGLVLNFLCKYLASFSRQFPAMHTEMPYGLRVNIRK